MTKKEFFDEFKDLPDDTPIAVCLPDGEMDYAALIYGGKDEQDQPIIVVSPN
jgi:hypothetical protein